jgi:hypothetical protein
MNTLFTMLFGWAAINAGLIVGGCYTLMLVTEIRERRERADHERLARREADLHEALIADEWELRAAYDRAMSINLDRDGQ